MGNLLNRITHPQVGRGCERIYYLSTVLELLCLLTSAPGESEFPAIRTLDRQIIQESMNTLKYNLDDPPSVGVLAEQAGVSPSKFKQLFPKVCGMTPYAYVRKLRMEKAFDLLQSGEMNVTEVAYEVGYESISHFSKVFFNYFGLKPSKVNWATLCRNKSPDSG
jgi:AraC-like DNA-binding protein